MDPIIPSKNKASKSEFLRKQIPVTFNIDNYDAKHIVQGKEVPKLATPAKAAPIRLKKLLDKEELS